MYFSSNTLYDTADSFVKDGGRFLFIDEVHKYPGWSRELKAMEIESLVRGAREES